MPYVLVPYVIWLSWVMIPFVLKAHYDPRLNWLISQRYPEARKKTE